MENKNCEECARLGAALMMERDFRRTLTKESQQLREDLVSALKGIAALGLALDKTKELIGEAKTLTAGG